MTEYLSGEEVLRLAGEGLWTAWEWKRELEVFKKALSDERAKVRNYETALGLIAAPKRADGTYNRSREACELLAQEALKNGKTP